MSCVCRCEEIVTEALRYSVKILKSKQNCTFVIKKTLKTVGNMLENYGCCSQCCLGCLERRIRWVDANISMGYTPLYEDEVVMVDMIITEIESFLGGEGVLK